VCSALVAMQCVNIIFTMDELYALLYSFEEKLKQVGDYQQNTKHITFPPQDFTTNTSPMSLNLYLSNESFIQFFYHECSNDVILISNLFHGC
jgi:hypothetical protein